MAEALGIGLVFKSIDKGLFKDLDRLASKIGVVKKASEGLQSTFDKLGKTSVQAKVASVSPAAQAANPATGNLGGVAAGAGKATGALNGMLSPLKLMAGGGILAGVGALQSALTGMGEVSQFTKDFDFLSQKMASVFDAKRVAAFQAQLKKGSLLGVSIAESTTIAEAFNQFGLDLTKSSSSLGTVQKLVGRLGMDAGTVANAFAGAESSLRFQKGDLEDLTNQVIAQGKAYGFVDNIKILPELLNNAAANSARLGVVSAKTNKKVINDLAGLTARFRKMNLSQTEAVSAAGKFNDQITDLRISVERMKVGLDPLDDKIFNLTASLAEYGVEGQEAFDLLASGDPGKIAEKLNSVASGLSGDALKRFYFQISDTFGEQYAQSITSFGKQTAAAADAAGKKLEKLDINDALNQEVKLRENTFTISEKTLEASRQLVQTTVEMANKLTTVTKNYKLAEQFQKTAAAIETQDSLLGKVLKTLNNINTNGVYGLLTSLGLSADAAAKLSAGLELAQKFLIGPFGKIVGMLGIFTGALSLAGGLILKAGKAVGWVGKQFGKLLPAPKSLSTLLTEAVEGVSSLGARVKNLTPKFADMFGKVFKLGARALGPLFGIADSITDGLRSAKESPGAVNFLKGFLFGPSVKNAGFGQMLVDIVGQSLKGAAYGAWFGPIGAGIGAAIGATVSIVKAAVEMDWINTMLESIGTFGYRLGNKLGEAVGYAAGWVVSKGGKLLTGIGEKISGIFSDAIAIDWTKILTLDNLKTQLSAFGDYLLNFAKQFVNLITSPGQAIANFLQGVIGGGFDGIKSGYQNFNDDQKAIQGNVKNLSATVRTVPGLAVANQPGAPGASAQGSNNSPASKDDSSFPGSEMFSMKEVVQKLLDKIDKLADRPLQVKIEGDLGKFLRAVDSEGSSQMARRGAG